MTYKVLGCAPSIETQAPCPTGHAVTLIEIPKTPDIEEKFKDLSEMGVFSIVFFFTLLCYLLARSIGVLIGMVR